MSAARPVRTPSQVLGFAHCGGMADGPENSLEAFCAALMRGVAALEADVWLTADGVPLLSHGRPRATAPPLAALFEVCGPDIDLSLDLPGRAVPAVVAVARAAGHDPQRLWLCGSGRELLRWRALAPGAHLVTDARRRDLLPARRAFRDHLRVGGVDAVNLHRRRWSTALVQRVHAAGLLAFAWHVQTRPHLDAALRMGLDAAYSDHVSLLVPGA